MYSNLLKPLLSECQDIFKYSFKTFCTKTGQREATLIWVCTNSKCTILKGVNKNNERAASLGTERHVNAHPSQRYCAHALEQPRAEDNPVSSHYQPLTITRWLV